MTSRLPAHPDGDDAPAPGPGRTAGRLGRVTTLGTGEVTYFDGKGGVFDEHGNPLPPRPQPVPKFVTLKIGGGPR